MLIDAPAREPIAAIDRRPIARAIRVRQELVKRTRGRLAPSRWTGLEATLALLSEEARSALTGRGAAATLRERLVAAAAMRYPAVQLPSPERAPIGLRASTLDAADRTLRGEWMVFGRRADAFAQSGQWRRHPVDGTDSPLEPWHRVRYLGGEAGGDVKYIWELNRHAELLRLAQAYYLTGREEYVARLSSLLRSWLRQNPPGWGINWSSSLEVSFRAVAWCWIWHLTRASRCWEGSLFPTFLWSLWHHARHIERYDSVHHSPNTHLTGEALGLLYVGTMFPEYSRSARWRALGAGMLLAEASHQILPDGMHFERATGYHRYTLEIYLHFQRISEAARWEGGERIADHLRLLAEASVALQRPDGRWPVLGDEDGGRAVPLVCGDATDQSDLVELASLVVPGLAAPATVSPSSSSAWWMAGEKLAAQARHAPPAPRRPSSNLVSAGYFVGRDLDPREPWYCLVDAGPHGGELTGHAHTDLGHVEIACGDEPIVCDAGSAGYTGDSARRDWDRSELAHASLSLDVPLAEPRGAFGWRRVAPEPVVSLRDEPGWWWCGLTSERRSAGGPVRHRRQVLLLRGWGVVVADWIVAGVPQRVTRRWPLAVAAAELERNSRGVEWRGTTVASCCDPAEPGTSVEVEEQEMAVTYGSSRRTAVLVERWVAVSALPRIACVTRTGRTVRFDADRGRVTCLAVDGTPTWRVDLELEHPPRVSAIAVARLLARRGS